MKYKEVIGPDGKTYEIRYPETAEEWEKVQWEVSGLYLTDCFESVPGDEPEDEKPSEFDFHVNSRLTNLPFIPVILILSIRQD